MGQNEEICYCLKAWNDLPDYVRRGQRPSKDDAMKVGARGPAPVLSRGGGGGCSSSGGSQRQPYWGRALLDPVPPCR